MGRDIIARGMASGAIKVNINAGHIFPNDTARDAYFISNPSELVENMYVYCNSKLQQYNGSTWIDRTPAIKGETGTGVPTGGTTNQVLTKNSNSDYDFSWIDLADVVVINKADVGLSNVDDTSDLDKPISILTQTALNLKADDLDLTTHTTNTNNPHVVTKEQIGLSDVQNVDTTNTANITDTSLKRFVSDTEKTVWNDTRRLLPGGVQGNIESGLWQSVTYGNGMFVAVTSTGINKVIYSVNGIDWTPVLAVEWSQWRSVTYGNGLFVAIASTGTNRVMYSFNGIDWTPVFVELNQWRSVTYGNGMFVAVASDGTNRVMYSVNGINWFYRNIPTLLWFAVAYGDGMFIALAQDSAQGLLTFGERTYSDKSKITSKSIITDITTTILSTDWTGAAPYEVNIPLSLLGEVITSTTHDIRLSIVLDNNIEIAKQEQEAYSYFSKGEISNTNVLKITCFDYKPAVDLNLNLEVVKKW